ncbi:MAG: hypothetical protein OIF34_00640, partial [Porticoccaceae bacterium]|nr:hypothetical protein [Porticoccaceae bacterium]
SDLTVKSLDCRVASLLAMTSGKIFRTTLRFRGDDEIVKELLNKSFEVIVYLYAKPFSVGIIHA